MLAIFSYIEAELGLRITSSSCDLQIAENRREAKGKGETKDIPIRMQSPEE